MAEATAEFEHAILPKVNIDERIEAPNCPYSVDVDPEGISKLLEAAGVKTKEVSNISINLIRRDPEGNRRKFAEYDPNDKSIYLYTDTIWNANPIYGRALGLLSEYKNYPEKASSAPDKNQFPELASGKRFSAYLKTVPMERGLAMARKLQALNVTRTTVTEGIGHEAKHAGDDSKGFIKDSLGRRALANVATGIGSGGVALLSFAFEAAMGGNNIDPNVAGLAFTAGGLVGIKAMGDKIYYRFFDQNEKRARQFGSEAAKGPSKRLITFTAKYPQKI